jgi:hypothetical protein
VRKRALSPPPPAEQKVFGLLARVHHSSVLCAIRNKTLVTINHVSKGAKKLAALSLFPAAGRKKLIYPGGPPAHSLVIFVCLFINQTSLLLNFVHTGVVPVVLLAMY